MEEQEQNSAQTQESPPKNKQSGALAIADIAKDTIGGVVSFQKISKLSSFLLLGTALFFDFLQAIVQPIQILGQVLAMGVDIFAFLTFIVWFLIIGVSFISPGRLVSIVGTFLVELVPVLDALPVWTFYILIMILLENSGIGVKGAIKLISKL